MSLSIRRASFQTGVLPLPARRGLMVLIIGGHAGLLWMVLQIVPPSLAGSDLPPMTVRLVQATPPAGSSGITIPLPEDTPPPVWRPALESMIAAPATSLPPPVFPIAAHSPPPPSSLARETAPAATSPGLRTVTEAEITYVRMADPVYPEAARRAGHSGNTLVKVLIDSAGVPAEVFLEQSSSHPLLDAEALRAVRAALFRPYLEDGLPRPVWILVPVSFVLLRQR